ncbi:hypothetical protein L6164_001196 [Bauhinia variegata]|uniref:Uncharacterized protein n=1 Tax=Bauhinia variegata TaxID=167791 RepID=A0ACB9Q8C8_BAUVA|nr:hypothetical protein L6164_001196 [Bauhinia variegata]
MYYWDSLYRCFTFNGIDLTPTLEEYGHMLGMPLKKQSPVYIYSKNKIAMKHISNLFGVSEQELAKEGAKMNGETCIWPMYFVKQCMEKFAAKNKWTELRDLIIAAIFGFVLFPTYKNSICREALDVYFKMMNEGRNLVPAILADTFIALNHKKIEEEYEEWFQNRGKNLSVPEATHPYFPPLPKETIQKFEVERELRSKLEQVKDKLLKYEREVKSLKEELDKVNEQLHDKETRGRMDDLKKKILASQSETSRYKRKHERIMANLEQCKKQKIEAEDDAKAKTLQCEKLKQQFFKAKTQYNHYTQYIEGLQTQYDNLSQSMHELQSQNESPKPTGG